MPGFCLLRAASGMDDESCNDLPMHADESVARATAHYPVADISPSEFEEFVVDLLQSASGSVGAFEVTLHDKLQGADGQ